MNITRRSAMTGIRRTMEIDVTSEQIFEWTHGRLIQDAMPKLTRDEREFIQTGITADEWTTLPTGEEE